MIKKYLKRIFIILIICIGLYFIIFKGFPKLETKIITWMFGSQPYIEAQFDGNNKLSVEDREFLLDMFRLNKEYKTLNIVKAYYDGIEYQNESSAYLVIEIEKNEYNQDSFINYNQAEYDLSVESSKENNKTIEIKIRHLVFGISVDKKYLEFKNIVNKYK